MLQDDAIYQGVGFRDMHVFMYQLFFIPAGLRFPVYAQEGALMGAAHGCTHKPVVPAQVVPVGAVSIDSSLNLCDGAWAEHLVAV